PTGSCVDDIRERTLRDTSLCTAAEFIVNPEWRAITLSNYRNFLVKRKEKMLTYGYTEADRFAPFDPWNLAELEAAFEIPSSSEEDEFLDGPVDWETDMAENEQESDSD